MTNKITWREIETTLGELIPWADNPKFSTKKQARAILASWEKYGQADPFRVSPSLQVLDGHQRLSALLTLYSASYTIRAWQSSVEFSEEERLAFVVTMHAGAVGSWDWDKLAAADAKALQSLGMDGDLLANLNKDALNLREMLTAENPPEFPEYGEDTADGVSACECPTCGHKHAKKD